MILASHTKVVKYGERVARGNAEMKLSGSTILFLNIPHLSVVIRIMYEYQWKTQSITLLSRRDSRNIFLQCACDELSLRINNYRQAIASCLILVRSWLVSLFYFALHTIVLRGSSNPGFATLVHMPTSIFPFFDPHLVIPYSSECC